MNNNKQSRTLVNFIGIPFILLTIYLGGVVFTSFIFIIIFLCTQEFDEICRINGIYIQIMWIYLFYILIFINHFIPVYIIKIENIELLYLLLSLISISEIFRNKNKPIENIAISIFIIIWIGLFLNYMILIRNINDYGFILILTMFLSVWICDTCAFFFGSKFGRKKILKSISPKKTWVGTLSGFLFTFLFNFILYKSNVFLFLNYNFSLIDVLNFSIIFGFIGQIGDFIESMFKRQVNIKDSGTILRGHGGMLDRMDSLILVSPCFYLYLKFIIGING